MKTRVDPVLFAVGGERSSDVTLQRRLLWTIGPLVVYALLEWVPPFGVDSSADPRVVAFLRPMSLGVVPGVWAHVLVRFGAHSVPRWRPLLISASGSATLERLIVWLTVALACFQAFALVNLTENLQDLSPSLPVLDGQHAPVLIGVGLLTGALLSFLLARKISQFGLVDGFVLLFLAWFVEHLVRAISETVSTVITTQPLRFFVALILPLVASWRAIVPAKMRAAEQSEESLSRPFAVGVPLCSVLPVLLSVLAIGWLINELRKFDAGRPLADSLAGWSVYCAAFVISALLLALVLSFRMAPPRAIETMLACFAPSRERARQEARVLFFESLWPTLLLIVVLTASELTFVSIFNVGNVAVALVVTQALLVDLYRSLRFYGSGNWTLIWSDARLPWTYAVRELVAREGISMHETFLLQSSLLRVFAPSARAELYVPKDCAPRALELVQCIAASAANGPPLTADGPIAPQGAYGSSRSRELTILAALAIANVWLIR